jgi:tripartite-type tricarboxylate transporter receptor subunit TctC
VNSRHLWRVAVIAAVALCGVQGASAQKYPDRPVRLIVPFPAGGSIDTLGRLVADKLGALWGQSMFVENRPGAGGNIGTEVAAQSAPDGYTLDIGGQFMAANVTIAPTREFDPRKNLAPVILMATGQDVLMVPPDSPYHSVKDIIEDAKKHPDTVTFASLGVGSSGHLATVLFSEVTGIKMQHVPYNSFGQTMTDVGAGRISMWIATLGGAVGQIQAGKVRALAVSGPTRAAQFPDIPTFDELGVAYGNDTSWYGLFAPASTPREIIAKINADTMRVLADPALKERATALGFRIVGGTPEALGTFLNSEVDKWAKVAKDGGLTMN